MPLPLGRGPRQPYNNSANVMRRALSSNALTPPPAPGSLQELAMLRRARETEKASSPLEPVPSSTLLQNLAKERMARQAAKPTRKAGRKLYARKRKATRKNRRA